MFVCEWWRDFLFFYLRYGHKKQESQKNYVYVHPWWSEFQILIWEKKQKWEKNDSKEEWKKSRWEVEALVTTFRS
jgi:hypothetical protein